MNEPTSPSGPPDDILRLVRERSDARAARNWKKADAIKAQLEEAGWRVVDRGTRSSVHRAAPASVDVGGERRFGSAADVPSAWDEPTSADWTVVIPASEDPARISSLLAALRSHAPIGTQVVVVANDPSDAQAAALAPGAPDRAQIGGRDVEVLRTAVRLAHAAALNLALRRAAGKLVLVADASAAPRGDAFGPLAEALGNPEVAVAGAFGLAGDEESGPFRPGALERVAPPEADATTPLAVTALESGWLAFRREDLIALGELDEHFATPAWLDVWLSLRLRCGVDGFGESESADDFGASDGVEGEKVAPEPDPLPASAVDAAEPAGADLPPPKRALAVSLPVERPKSPWPPDRTRLSRRNMYRVLRRFGWRDDLG